MTPLPADSPRDASGPAPLSATRAYRFSVGVRADGARTLMIPTARRGSWDDYGVEEREEQGAYVRRALAAAGDPGRGSYPGEWVFDDDASLAAGWAAVTSRLRAPAAAPPEIVVTRDVAATDAGAVGGALLARALAVASAISPARAANFTSSGRTLDPRRTPPLLCEIFRCGEVIVVFESQETPGCRTVRAVVAGVAGCDGVRAELDATLGPSGGSLRALVAGVFDADDVARLFTG